jgi:hypothetical protein
VRGRVGVGGWKIPKPKSQIRGSTKVEHRTGSLPTFDVQFNGLKDFEQKVTEVTKLRKSSRGSEGQPRQNSDVNCARRTASGNWRWQQRRHTHASLNGKPKTMLATNHNARNANMDVNDRTKATPVSIVIRTTRKVPVWSAVSIGAP